MLARAAVELQAANGALARLGEARLASLDENRAAARAIKDAFGSVRDALLRRHVWNFALTWATLARDPTAPAGSFANAFPLPSDYLRVVRVNELPESAWSVETARGAEDATALRPVLYTDAASARIGYIRSVEHVSLWDPLFLEIFELELAARISGVLGHSGSDALTAEAGRKLASARRIDEREASRGTVTRNVSFVSVRL